MKTTNLTNIQNQHIMCMIEYLNACKMITDNEYKLKMYYFITY